MKRLVFSLLLAIGLRAQSPPPYNLQISQQPLPIVDGQQIRATYTGIRGSTTIFYTIIARYGVGNASPSMSVVVPNTDSSGTVSLNWNAPASPSNYTLTYDVIRLTSANFPNSGTCTNCLLSSATSALTATDTLVGLAGYTLNSYGLSSANINIDNTNTSYAGLYDNIASHKYPTSVLNGTALPIYCNNGDPFWNTTTSSLYVCSSNNVWVLIGNGMIPFGPGISGAICNGVTDDTQAFQNTVNTLLNANGGTIFVIGQCLLNSATITFPNTGGTAPKQKSLRITGLGSSANGYWTQVPDCPSELDMRFNASVGKFDTRGAGNLELDHICLKDGGTDTASFIQTTNTTVNAHDMAVIGSGLGQDVFIFGGNPNSTCSGLDGTSGGCFQGYNSQVHQVFFSAIRSAVRAMNVGFSNNIFITNNTISNDAASGTVSRNTSITTCTNANPTVCTFNGIVNLSLVVASQTVRLSGFTGNWTALNGAQVATNVSGTQASFAVNATAFGAVTGTGVMSDAAAFEIAGAANRIDLNLIEATRMIYGVHIFNGAANTAIGNSCWDATTSFTLACVRLDANVTSTYTVSGIQQDAPYVNGESGHFSNQFVDPYGAQQNSAWVTCAIGSQCGVISTNFQTTENGTFWSLIDRTNSQNAIQVFKNNPNGAAFYVHNGIGVGSLTYAFAHGNLGAGQVVYCTNCTVAACSSAGTGAWFFKTQASESCPF